MHVIMLYLSVIQCYIILPAKASVYKAVNNGVAKDADDVEVYLKLVKPHQCTTIHTCNIGRMDRISSNVSLVLYIRKLRRRLAAI